MSAIETKMIGLNMANADVDIDTTQLDIVEVTIVYDYAFITPMIAGLVDSLALTGNASMVSPIDNSPPLWCTEQSCNANFLGPFEPLNGTRPDRLLPLVTLAPNQLK